MNNNENNLVIVTGGSKGIGKSIVELFLSKGFTVFFTYRNSKDEAQKIINKNPKKCKAFKVDGKNPSEIYAFAEKILSTKTPYILINNAGINNDDLFINQTVENFWHTLENNLGSTLHFCKAFLSSMMEKRDGHIINISSVAAVKPKIGNSAYGTSKIAIERFSKSLALEVARFNISVNCVSPGFVETKLINDFINGSGGKKKFYSQIPTRKILSAAEVSNMVYTLCSNKLFTTGSVFYIGNGENVV